MNPQIQAILQALLGFSNEQPSQEGSFEKFSAGQGLGLENSALTRAVGGFSPVNVNPNYGSAVNRFFNQNPLAGPQAFTGSTPLQTGTAGNNAVRAGRAHSSFMPNDFGSSMQQWTQ